jgi:hypothetical protein
VIDVVVDEPLAHEAEQHAGDEPDGRRVYLGW